jgi:hypothetical protein
LWPISVWSVPFALLKCSVNAYTFIADGWGLGSNPAPLTEALRRFLQSLRANVIKVPHITQRPRPLIYAYVSERQFSFRFSHRHVLCILSSLPCVLDAPSTSMPTWQLCETVTFKKIVVFQMFSGCGGP